MIRSVVIKSVIRVMFPLELKRYSFYIKPTVRLCLIVVFVRSTFAITLSWTSLISLLLLLVSYLFFKSKDQNDQIEEQASLEVHGLFNPFKGKTGIGHLTKERQMEIALAIEEFILDDPGKAKCLDRFEVIKANSECIFAKRAKVWGSPDYVENVSLEENMRRVYLTLLKFTFAFMDLGLGAFLVELPGSLYGKDIKTFADAVGQMLYIFRLQDLKRVNKQRSRKMTDISLPQSKLEQANKRFLLHENTKDWEKMSWVFEINKITFFLTTFAPFYPETNSRYSHGSEDCYILFQPEISFAIHDLPSDTPNTNWTCPITVRDKIRVAFNNAGRYYEPPMKLQEPMVYDIVKRVNPEDEVVRWWNAKARNAAYVE